MDNLVEQIATNSEVFTQWTLALLLVVYVVYDKNKTTQTLTNLIQEDLREVRETQIKISETLDKIVDRLNKE